jgi:hypothetical protein
MRDWLEIGLWNATARLIGTYGPPVFLYDIELSALNVSTGCLIPPKTGEIA